jgi:hypothetical protein
MCYTVGLTRHSLAALAGGCRFEQSYFDQENWCVVAVKL